MTKKIWIALSCLAVAGLASQSMAASGDATETYTKYHEAIRVAEICRNDHTNQGTTGYDISTWDRMAKYIDTKVNNEIGAGERLALIEQAKSQAWTLVEKKGCASEEATGLLAIYDNELAKL